MHYSGSVYLISSNFVKNQYFRHDRRPVFVISTVFRQKRNPLEPKDEPVMLMLRINVLSRARLGLQRLLLPAVPTV